MTSDSVEDRLANLSVFPRARLAGGSEEAKLSPLPSETEVKTAYLLLPE